MKCSNCGQEVKEGELFCPNCGEEIQWVPDYDSLGTYMEKERLKKEKEAEQAARRKAAHQAELRIRNRRKKRNRRIAAVVTVLAVVIIIFIWRYSTVQRNYNDFDYQLTMADTSLSNGKYEEALEYVERALELDESSQDALYLKAQILLKEEDPDEAIEVLLAMIEADSSNTDAYSLLIKTYLAQDQAEEVKNLLDACEDETVLTKFASYISEAPVFSLPEGSYSEDKTLSLYAKEDGDTIYYTTDGSDPTTDSDVYTGSIDLEEGTTTVKAMVVNEKGIPSDVISRTYEIEYDAPDAPKISPSSGTFTTDMDTEIIVIVPDGCRAYYAWDEEPTIADELYTGPVSMKIGTHTFYAIIVDEHNQVSEAASVKYTLKYPD